MYSDAQKKVLVKIIVSKVAEQLNNIQEKGDLLKNLIITTGGFVIKRLFT
jgi:hypothetical protein